ncbi:hypothetical protein EES39_38520 [Streptomyces sp. ADI92-24]|uniref:hypothetical protein n=1 Tax=Streptomyces sp. ADI92-24 TaxID=1522756 RepID=UPI000FB934C3|nr:hypothetical protein [Streptomyces sp. ADI92-24]RPK32384.1 hypothetical protein EES39_38520 [Streptomyces sp. ADI92-24]
MSTSADQTAAARTSSHPAVIAQHIADVVINLVRFLGPDPAVIVRTETARKGRPQG